LWGLYTKTGRGDKTADLEEFSMFFPDTAREQLETVEYYHCAVTGITGKQFTE